MNVLRAGIGVFIFMFLTSCGKENQEGFLGSWKGSTITISDNEPVSAITTLEVTVDKGMDRKCDLAIGSIQYDFSSKESGDALIIERQEPSNVSDSLMTTYISGTSTLLTDTSMVMTAELVFMKGASVLGSQIYELDFVRAE